MANRRQSGSRHRPDSPPSGALVPLWLVANDISETARAPLELRLPWKSVQRRSLGSFRAAPFQAKAVLRVEPDLGLMSCFDPAPRWTMPRALADGVQRIAVIRPSDGILVAEQNSQRKTCFQREAIVINTAEETTFVMTGISRLDCFIFSGTGKPQDAPAVGEIVRIRRDNGALVVLGHYAAALMRGLLPMNSTVLTSLATEYMRSLTAAMIDAADFPANLAQSVSARPSPGLIAVKADIEVRLAQKNLSLTSFARSQGVTVRHLQKLFEADGQTFSEYVLERRLERARQLLLDFAVVQRSISSIAFDLGFGDLSYFNRTFKKRFGATPREVRSRGKALLRSVSDEPAGLASTA
jgi:AraC-like DNA-binding protein